MKILSLTKRQKENFLALTIVLLGFSVLLGQLFEAKYSAYRDLLSTQRMYSDPSQYMVGMLIINFILVWAAIKKYEEYPNRFLGTLKWYFSLLFINDFLVLILRVLQKSGLTAVSNILGIGMGKAYMTMGVVRGLTDLTMASTATLLLVYGLTRYSPTGLNDSDTDKRLAWVMPVLVVFQWLTAAPVNMPGSVSRAVFAWSLGISRTVQVALAALLYLVVKQQYQRFNTSFFFYLARYFALSLAVTGLVFTYSMGSYEVLQRFPAGETGMVGGFGFAVFSISRGVYIVLNYWMFQAIFHYSEVTQNVGAWGKAIRAK